MRLVTSVMIRSAAVLTMAGLSSLSAAPRASTITVMTQNMDAGTDLGFALAYLNTETPLVGIDLTYQEVLQGDFQHRAEILASQIAASRPDLVSLQEVTLWSTGSGPLTLTPLFDQLGLLTQALADLGENYTLVDTNYLTSLAAPMSNGAWLGFQDQDVVLVRDDSGLTVNSVQEGTYAAKLTIPVTPLGPITIKQGWIAVNATLDGETLTLVDTHLAGLLPGLPVGPIQTAQAEELVGLFGDTDHLLIAGDFNTNASHTPPEQTPTFQLVIDSGLTDTWSAAHHGNPGFTWPLYVEDPFGAHPNGPFERIDFIFEDDFGIQSVERIGWTGAHASDHAGVIATLSF